MSAKIASPKNKAKTLSTPLIAIGKRLEQTIDRSQFGEYSLSNVLLLQFLVIRISWSSQYADLARWILIELINEPKSSSLSHHIRLLT